MAKENTASTTDQVSPVKDVEQKKSCYSRPGGIGSEARASC